MARTREADIEELLAREILRGADAVLDAHCRLMPQHGRSDHMRASAEFYARVAAGEPQRVVLSSPPRWGKTTINIVGIAWLMFVRPGIRVGVICCTSALAESISRQVRTLVERLGVRIARDQRSVAEWACANGSSLAAFGSSSAIVGRGFDLILMDDLVPSMEAAQSETQREATELFLESTVLGRMEPGASAMLCMHRWSPNDISGRLIDRGWPWVNVPALDHAGATTWPARWSTAELRQKEQDVGPLVWAAMYQGHPRAAGGLVFGAAPSYYDPNAVRAQLVRGCDIVLGVDPAVSAKTTADYSVILVAAFTHEAHEIELPAGAQANHLFPTRMGGASTPRRRATRLDYRVCMNVIG